MKLEELQRLAEGARADGDWFPPDFGHGYIGRADAAFMSAMSPDTAKKLIAVALKASEYCEALTTALDLSESVDGGDFFAATDKSNAAYRALRTALEELN